MPREGSPVSWRMAGRDEGERVAHDNLSDPIARRKLMKALRKGRRLDEYLFSGEVSYDLGPAYGSSETQYDAWEEGFSEGFQATVKRELGRGAERYEKAMRRRRR